MKRPYKTPDHGKSSDYGCPSEQQGFLKTSGRKIDQLMRQFIKGGDGPRGNTQAFQDGWERIFGGRANG